MRTADAAQRRQIAIELLLLWEGSVSNARLRELFGIHVTLASRDLATYRSQHEGQLQPARGGVLEATSWARPALTKGEFREYLELVGLADAGDGALATVPVATVAPHVPELRFTTVRAVQQAIRHACALDIEYGSLNHPERHARRVFPHALAKAGPRWHVRAWCTQRASYRDFNLGRIYAAQVSTATLPADTPGDVVWGTQVKLRFTAHPALSAAQQRLVRDEYMQGTSALAFDTRLALVPYVVQAYRAAVDPESQRPPDYLLHATVGGRPVPPSARFGDDEL